MKKAWMAVGICSVVVVATIAVIFSRKNGSGAADAAPEHYSSPPARRVERTPRELSSRWQPLLDPARSREERLEIVRGVRDGVSRMEAEDLLGLMDHRPTGAGQEEWWVILNEIMDQLGKNGVQTTTFCDRLVELAADPSQPEVVRDYAIQHLSNLVAPVVPDRAEGLDDVRKLAGIKAISAAIKDPSGSYTTVPGTGLLALAEISSRVDRSLTQPVWKDLQSFLLPLIEGRSDAGLPVRTSAIQAVALNGEDAYLPAIRNIAGGEAVSPSLRLSSIAALGLYGRSEDVPILERLSAAGHPYQYAAKAALARIQR